MNQLSLLLQSLSKGKGKEDKAEKRVEMVAITLEASMRIALCEQEKR